MKHMLRICIPMCLEHLPFPEVSGVILEEWPEKLANGEVASNEAMVGISENLLAKLAVLLPLSDCTVRTSSQVFFFCTIIAVLEGKIPHDQVKFWFLYNNQATSSGIDTEGCVHSPPGSWDTINRLARKVLELRRNTPLALAKQEERERAEYERLREKFAGE